MRAGTGSRHAEVVGAGFGGLVAAIGLADRGWSVRVHERRPELREAGYGIAIQDNMVRIFEALGLRDAVLTGGMEIDLRDSLDGHGRLILRMRNGLGRHRISRHHIITCLAARAKAAGVEIVTASTVTNVDPAGALTTADGTRYRTDLVVVADGINSPFAAELGLFERVTPESGGAVRVTIPRTAEEIASGVRDGTIMVEAWADRRRVLHCPNTSTELYVILTCTPDDAAGMRLPLDLAAWTASFPALADLLARTHAEADWSVAHWARFKTVRLRRWSTGQIAVLGDAAHAMPPYLGQGAGHAMMNALGLAVAIAATRDVERALAEWETRERPLTEHTQRWTRRYGATLTLPNALKPLAIRAERDVPWIARQYARAANHVPTGCAMARAI